MSILKLIKLRFFTDRKFRIARIWSNRELKKYAHLFTGDIINVSAWQDRDKEGFCYKDYFINANKYHLSNYKKEARGFQGYRNEFFLDLEKKLDKNLTNRFDVVFSHTVLEHIYNFKTAFQDLCLLTKDIVILIIPCLQQMHAGCKVEYGDYWRFTPLAIKRMFEENSMTVLYSSFSNYKRSSVYLFFIASKNPEKWRHRIFNKFNYKYKKDPLDFFGNHVGCRVITNSWFFKINSAAKIIIKKLGSILKKHRVK